MSANYTEEQVKHMVAEYTAEPTRETVENLAEELEKSVKSIIGKLAREGVYQKVVYKTKTGEDPITKKQLVTEIAELLVVDYIKIAGLEKAPKADLKILHKEIKGEYDD